MLSRCLVTLNLRVGGFAPRHLRRWTVLVEINVLILLNKPIKFLVQSKEYMQKLKLKFLFLATIIFIFGVSASFAQQTISPEKQNLIREFLEVTGAQKNANEMGEMMITYQEKETPKMLASLVENDKSLTATQKQEMQQMMIETAERVSKRYREFFSQKLNIGQMLEEVSYPIYDKNFTESELRDLIAFYKTPTGQKMIQIAPKMTMEAMMAFNEKFTPKLQEFMKETAESELALLKQKLQNGNGKKAARKS